LAAMYGVTTGNLNKAVTRKLYGQSELCEYIQAVLQAEALPAAHHFLSCHLFVPAHWTPPARSEQPPAYRRYARAKQRTRTGPRAHTNTEAPRWPIAIPVEAPQNKPGWMASATMLGSRTMSWTAKITGETIAQSVSARSRRVPLQRC
jgi:hypothetical protein